MTAYFLPRPSQVRLGAAALLALAGLTGHARAQSPAPPTAVYWDNWVDHNGVSHMTRCQFHTYTLKTVNKPAAPQWSDPTPEGTAQVVSTVQPSHWNGAWHPDPKVQWIIPLKGSWWVQAQDGTRVTLNPGDVSLGEDQMSKPDAQGHRGHLAGNVGDGPVTLMVVQLAEKPTVDQPCRFK